jgi:hypothetical protein
MDSDPFRVVIDPELSLTGQRSQRWLQRQVSLSP